jgi:hypothetical protein
MTAVRTARAGSAGRSLLRGGVLLAAMVVGAAWPAQAEAQVVSDRIGTYHSPQRFALELRFGPYRPDIDSEFGGARTPHKDFFGSNRKLMSQIEFDYQFLRHVGTVAIGVGVGYFSQSGKNRTPDGQLSEDWTTLRLIPLSVSGVYRFDLLFEHFGIPLVPYGKVGLDYVIWTIANGNGDVPEDPVGGRGRGGTLGWHAAVGLSLVLDFMDPITAQQFDVEMGVNHTHLFAELGHWDVSGLGMSNRLRVGDTTWVGGLLFEF